MALPQLPLVGPVLPPTPFILKNLLVPGQTISTVRFMAFSTAPGLNSAVFIDSQAAMKTASGCHPMDPISLRYSWKRTCRPKRL
ncbi:hypothetical protein TNCV_3957861 [Trichonephila clavipes]|nr:hypothetical protein TNCV_3957861 [Trichonephila clavipes]